METSSSGPPGGSSCAIQAQNELNGADLSQQKQQQPVAQATNLIPSPAQMGAAKAAAQGAQERGSPPAKKPVFNYALMASKGLPKTKSESRREWSALRSEIDTTSVREELVPSPLVMFTRE
ncbi:hypothetical protein BGZ49_002489, partial [Haplosporangium sp. Z 27]